jgi:YHS domain-containing protein
MSERVDPAKRSLFRKETKMNLRKIILLTAVVVIGLGLTACKKKEQPTPPPKASAKKNVQKPTEKAQETSATEAEQAQAEFDRVKKEAEEAVKKMDAETEQTTCPVMDGNPINKNIFVEYKGKKVYFCCEKCKATFEKDPEKYIANLPQFAK